MPSLDLRESGGSGEAVGYSGGTDALVLLVALAAVGLPDTVAADEFHDRLAEVLVHDAVQDEVRAEVDRL